MKRKVKEIRCRSADGREVTVVHWLFDGATPARPAGGANEFRLEDGTPVLPVGGRFEHFYSGEIFYPI